MSHSMPEFLFAQYISCPTQSLQTLAAAFARAMAGPTEIHRWGPHQPDVAQTATTSYSNSCLPSAPHNAAQFREPLFQTSKRGLQLWKALRIMLLWHLPGVNCLALWHLAVAHKTTILSVVSDGAIQPLSPHAQGAQTTRLKTLMVPQ